MEVDDEAMDWVSSLSLSPVRTNLWGLGTLDPTIPHRDASGLNDPFRICWRIMSNCLRGAARTSGDGSVGLDGFCTPR